MNNVSTSPGQLILLHGEHEVLLLLLIVHDIVVETEHDQSDVSRVRSCQSLVGGAV